MILIAIDFEDNYSAFCYLNAILQQDDAEIQDVWKDPETGEICFSILKKKHDNKE